MANKLGLMPRSCLFIVAIFLRLNPLPLSIFIVYFSSSFHVICYDCIYLFAFCVNISEVVLKLRSVLGVDAQALLSRYGLLKHFQADVNRVFSLC